MNTMIPFFESTDPDFKATETVGSFNSANRAKYVTAPQYKDERRVLDSRCSVKSSNRF